MLKLTKKSDYGLIALKHLATRRSDETCSAADIAAVYGISAPLLAKVLQKLARKGLVTAKHGSAGGYMLARDPAQITALEVINAIDGPLFITSCMTTHGECFQTTTCTVREPLRRINESICQVLSTVTISQMAEDSNGSAIVELRT
jgi:FeS assembly SUF system regulator